MKRIVNRTAFCLIASICLCTGCFNLDEEPFDRLSSNIYYQNESSIKGIIGRLYHSAMYAYAENFYFLQELTADQVAWHSWNGGTWGWDEGAKYELSTQTWTTQSTYIEKAWTTGWETIGLCNSALWDLRSLSPEDVGISGEKLDSYIAEVRTIRAWAYYKVFELWGGAIPLSTEPSDVIPGSADPDFNVGCRVIYDFISRELDESYPDLSKNDVNRMNQAANRILKARLLLNAQLFIGEDHYGECAQLCEELMQGTYGHYELAKDYRDIYSADNVNCREIVFAIAQDPAHLNLGWMRRCPFYHKSLIDYFTPKEWGSPWNAVILSPSYDNSEDMNLGGNPVCFLDAPYNDKLGAVYERFDDKDIRKHNFVYDTDNNTYSGMFLKGLMKADYGRGENLKADADRNGQDLVFVDQCGTFLGNGRGVETVMTPRWGETNSGIRLVKYPIYPESSGRDYREADEVEIRYSEVYYMLAECRLRDGDANAAKELVNKVRERYYSVSDWGAAKDVPGPGFDEFDMDWMLSEWGLEFLNEGQRRRTDLRRFDRFTQGQWWFFGRADDSGVSLPAKRDRKYEWFPLPYSAFLSNPGLVQNPAYVM